MKEDEKEGGKEVDSNKKESEEGEVKSQQIVCPICDKTFSSGKAFGGHKSSAHVQSKGQKSSSKKLKRKYKCNSSAKSVAEYDDFVDDDEDGDYYYYYSERLIGKRVFKKRKIGLTCHHCNKDFSSKNALFGHMRCHPDRPYRGMEAPESSTPNDENDDDRDVNCKSEFEEVEEEEVGILNQENVMFSNDLLGEGTSGASKATPVVDLLQDLVGVGWFGKGRRRGGDEAIANSSSALVEKSDSISNNRMYDGDDDDSFEECRMASHLLMYLHNSGGSKTNLDDERVVEEAISSPSESMDLFLDFAISKKTAEKSEQSSNEEAEVAGVISQLKKNKGKSKAILENDNDGNDNNNNSSDDEVARKLDYARKGKGKIAGKRKRKTKYNDNAKVIIKLKKLPSSSFLDGDYLDMCPPPPQPTSENRKGFRCSSCGKIFPSHQALGGHKSSHNKFRMSIENTIDDHHVLSSEMVCDESPSSRARRSSKKKKNSAEEVQKMLDFDLNQLPEEES